MSEAKSTSLDIATWEVPDHDVALYRAKHHSYALVIPVINEGERIRGQLKRIQDAGLNIDVVVADGGSTDGSLDAAFIGSVEVRAVLTKTGPGKLSAQLRVAYAWCLSEGYNGIVTIDGNGKDGVEAIGDMIAKLDEGCDYVQGSRYLPGGLAENTPLERTIANRFVHAPLLSLAAGSFFSDTTNGFRAYSSRYLLHPDVQPFRDEFQVYGLLFYLTVRAGQLGLKVDQIPVKRRYPESGKVPTKIGGFASKLALLGETIHAATGGHTPDRAGRASASLLWPTLLLLAVVAPILLSVVVAPPYSPDSWAFWELAQTVFGDFYRVTHFRSYANDVGYSSAFPPLYPSLIALADTGLGTGVRSGLYLAFASYFGFAIVSELVGRRLLSTPWLGLSAALLILFGPNMVLTEMQAGRTIPLQLLLYAFVLLGLCDSKELNFKRAIAIGLIAGLCVLNRFDAVFFPIVTAGLIVWLTRKPTFTFVSLTASAAAIAPWIAYSWVTFAVPFATDNSGIATSLDPRAFVTDWWPAPQPSAADDPTAWLVRVAGNLPSLLYTAASLAISPLGFVCVLAIVPIVGLQYLASRRPVSTSRPGSSVDGLSLLWVYLGAIGALLLPQILTGYLEYRYFSAAIWIAALCVFAAIAARGITVVQRQTYAKLIALPIAITALVLACLQLTHASLTGRLDFQNWSAFAEDSNVAEVEACLSNQPMARLLVIGDDNLAARLGALGGVPAMMEPRNMAQGRLTDAQSRDFVQTWQVRYLLVVDEQRGDAIQSIFNSKRLPNCSLMLFKVEG